MMYISQCHPALAFQLLRGMSFWRSCRGILATCCCTHAPQASLIQTSLRDITINCLQVEKNYYLHQSAREAYRSYILAYNSHQLKDIFNVHRLDLQVCLLVNMGGVLYLCMLCSLTVFYIASCIRASTAAPGQASARIDDHRIRLSLRSMCSF